jgi:nitronate monooxygenase
MFIVSGPRMVVAQCKAGIVGSFPALNARPAAMLDQWLTQIRSELDACRADEPQRTIGPFAVNLICHPSNDRLAEDTATCVRHRVPIVITSLQAPKEVVDAVHSYGGMLLHDVISVRHAEKALEHGADGLILVCAGAGGHAGTLSPFALVQEVRRFFAGPLALSGSIATGRAILAAEVLGADFSYIGTRFIATEEANADPAYKQMVLDSSAKDIVYSSLFTGVSGNYLKPSVAAAGLDPDNLQSADKSTMDFGSKGKTEKKAWRDIWSAGQGVGTIDRLTGVAECVSALAQEYRQARAAIGGG